MKGLDQAEADKEGDLQQAFKDRVKADDIALKTIKDLQTELTTIYTALSADDASAEMTDEQKKTLKVAIASYQHEAVKSNIAQAYSLK